MKAGRPRLEVDKQLILSLRAKGWGYRRIAKAHIEKSGYVSPGTVRNIIRASSSINGNVEHRYVNGLNCKGESRDHFDLIPCMW